MDKNKLDEIVEHAELIQKLSTLIPASNHLVSRRTNTIVREAEMIIQLVRSLQDTE